MTVCVTCGGPVIRRGSKTCGTACADEFRNARARYRTNLKRAPVSDISPEQELKMRRRTRKCKLCGIYMTSKPWLPNSKELDHIITISQGGTHTHGNVRIICRACNQKRPKDGRDYAGPVTLWAQGELLVSRPKRTENSTMCRNGLHPWTGRNIETYTYRGKQMRRCRACSNAGRRRWEARSGNTPVLKTCPCGAGFPSRGNAVLCVACTDANARRGAELHAAGGLTWDQVASAVGFGSGWGLAYAAKRIGYIPAEPQPRVKALALRQCGTCRGDVEPGARGCHSYTCDRCVASTAARAARLWGMGITLRDIANELGFKSQTTVSNMLKAHVIGAPTSLHGHPPLEHMSEKVHEL